MEGSRRATPAELLYDLPLLEAPRAVEADAHEIEAEVMVLFERYRAPILRYAVSFGVPVPDAEEIVQEVFLALFRHLRLGRSRKNLPGWIFRVAHNLTLRQRHANKRKQNAIDNDPGLAAMQIDPSPDPEQSFSGGQRQRRLMAVVESLPDVEQSCLRLRAEGMRYREIAMALGISLGSVSTFLTRSLAKLIRVDRG